MCTLLLVLINLFCYTRGETNTESSDGSLVKTNYGYIRGIVNEIGRSFTGIPYAKPPTPENDLRFRNPVPPNNWNNILNTTTIAPLCMQSDCNIRGITCYKSTGAIMSEDCLYLNVYTPPLTSEQLPVMFYIHGGTYIRQWSGSDLYDGQKMAYLNDVIVVTINYRVGSFGFFYDPSNGFDGNYGYFDQLLALKFVYENIEYFGGDNSKIVLFGESAGAMSVASLLMDATNTMYSGAIMLSDPAGLPFRTSGSWQNVPSKYVEYAGCDENTENCMRKEVTSEQLLTAQNNVRRDLLAFCRFFNCYWIFVFMPWTPTFKTEALPQTQPLQAFLDGNYNKVPIIMVSNDDEGVSFVYDLTSGIFNGSYDHGLCRSQYKALIYAIMGEDDGNKIIEQYRPYEPDCSEADYRPLLSKIVGEFWFICPSRNITESISGYSNVWKSNYNYLYVFDPPERYFGDNVYCQGVDENICHGAALPVVFQSKTLEFSKRDIKLSNLIQEYFTNVARSGEPGLKWKNYVLPTEWSMIFTNKGKGKMRKRYEENNGFNCTFWDNLGYPQLWWQDSPFSVSDLLHIFGNKTFRNQLNASHKCDNDCYGDRQYAANMLMSQRDDTDAFIYGQDAVNILVVFVYFFVGAFFLGLGLCVGSKCLKK